MHGFPLFSCRLLRSLEIQTELTFHQLSLRITLNFDYFRLQSLGKWLFRLGKWLRDFMQGTNGIPHVNVLSDATEGSKHYNDQIVHNPQFADL